MSKECTPVMPVVTDVPCLQMFLLLQTIEVLRRLWLLGRNSAESPAYPGRIFYYHVEQR